MTVLPSDKVKMILTIIYGMAHQEFEKSSEYLIELAQILDDRNAVSKEFLISQLLELLLTVERFSNAIRMKEIR